MTDFTQHGGQALQVRISMNAAPGGMNLFTPGGSMRWGNCVFRLNAPADAETDFWVVWANARPVEQVKVSPLNTLFIAGEPPAKKIYPRRYYAQFQHLVDTHNASGHPRAHQDALGLPWLVGLSWRAGGFTLGYDALKALPEPQKLNRVSVVCSTTAQTAGQKQRLKFLAALKEQLGDDLAVFGKGFQQVDDKLEAVLPYRYHLVLENSQSPHYWTEKLTDAYLGWAFPLYVGCPNLGDYFERESFLPLDMTDVTGASDTIRRLLEQPPDQTRLAALARARDKVLDVYNPFARFAHWANQLYQPAAKEQVIIRSEKAFRFGRGWFYRLQHRHS